MKYNQLSLKIFLFVIVFLNIFITKIYSANQAFIVMKINNEIITNINIENENIDLLVKEQIIKIDINNIKKARLDLIKFKEKIKN